ncbi:MAG: DUF5110 domain-containing protein [Planctomycetes bacterium]|nr:DUF5110 domain-containing protein [Planctomycetota bacterium]
MFKSSNLLDFTTLYRSGNPFKTEATVIDINSKALRPVSKIKHFKFTKEKGDMVFRYDLAENDKVYGLGGTLGGFNKRGRKYVLYATDDPNHTPDKTSLYTSYPFVMIDGEEKFAFLIDYPSEIIFDIGFTHKDVMEIRIPSNNFDFYIFNESDKLKVIKEYLTLTGAPYIPPKWAFGYQQCRWSYPDAKTVSNIAEGFRKNEMPCDAIYMDIDYMERYKVFTVDGKKFPRFKDFVGKMKKNGFKLIPIIDPGVKVEKGYDVYEDGKKKGCFCVHKDGRPFQPAVWPGFTHFPNFLEPEVRKWWGGFHKDFIDWGIEGFWNDMNEPSIFYTPQSLKDLNKTISAFDGKDAFALRALRRSMYNFSNRREYYKEFYHRMDDGRMILHHDIHNLYGFNMSRATAEAFNEFAPGRRYFLLTRSSCTGLHRFAALWTGDNASWWEHMLVQMRMMMALNMAGVFYNGADIGGFGGEIAPELLIRWMQLGAFSPLYRNHSSFATRAQEPWAFDKGSAGIMRNILKLRYAFIPYAYSEFMRSVKELKPFVSHLMFSFKGERVKDIEDQFMYGDSLMVAPVHAPGAQGRFVHLPENEWLHWNASEYNKRKMKVMEPGDYYVKCALESIPLFIKENSMIALTEPVNYIGEKETESLTVVAFVTGKASFTYYEDDGATYDFNNGDFSAIKIDIKKRGRRYDIALSLKQSDAMPLKIKDIRFEIYDGAGRLYSCQRKI